MIAKPAHNEHIGSMAALPPLEKNGGIKHLSPAGKYLEAATAPICQDVICHSGTETAQRLKNPTKQIQTAHLI
jgi:hypothetical protein